MMFCTESIEEALSIAAEIILLSDAQRDALGETPYSLMPSGEREAYDKRRGRIVQLYVALNTLRLEDRETDLKAAS
jgi:hypothetical protein